MKKISFILFLFAAFPVFSQQPAIDSLHYIPPAKGWVNDFVGLFSQDEISGIDSLVADYRKKTSIQIVVTTVDSSMMGPMNIQDYALLMLRTWGIGEKEKNNGILILIAPGLHRMRVQNGYGIEKLLSNRQTKDIIDTVFIPHFKNDEFYLGTKEGITALVNKLLVNGYK